jgi:hypothetical protein
MLVKSANLTFRQIVKSANREGGEHDRTHNLMLANRVTHYALRITPMRPSLIAPRTSNLGLPARFLEHTYAPLTATFFLLQ